MNLIITAAFVESLLQRNPVIFDWDLPQNALAFPNMPVHSWRKKFKRQCFVRAPAEVVFRKVEEKKNYLYPYIGFSIYWIKFWSYIFYECFITASYLQVILFLKKPFFFPHWKIHVHYSSSNIQTSAPMACTKTVIWYL